MLNINDYIGKIVCADCMDILKQLPDKCVDLVITSPPYNLNIEYKSYADNLPYDEYLLWCKEWIGECNRVLKEGGRVAINIPIETNLSGKKFICNDYMNILKSFGLIETAFILWDKQNVTSRTAWGSWCSPSNPNIIQPMECILVYSKGSRKKAGNKDLIDLEGQSFIDNTLGVWRIQPEKDRTHPAPFPIELPKRIMQMFSYKGDLILDCFSGSGTTAIACHNLKRRFICIEKDKDYWQASVERLENAQAQMKLF